MHGVERVSIGADLAGSLLADPHFNQPFPFKNADDAHECIPQRGSHIL